MSKIGKGAAIAAAIIAVVCFLALFVFVVLPYMAGNADSAYADRATTSINSNGRANNAVTPTVSPNTTVTPTAVATAKPTAAPIPTDTPTPPPVAVKTIRAHIVGAVVNPGVYELPDGARVNDLVEAAGGLTEDASDESVNMAWYVMDAEQVKIYTKSEWGAVSETPKPITQPNTPPVAGATPVAVPTDVPQSIPETGAETAPTEGTESAAGTATSAPSGIVNGKVNINAATLEELKTLPGIGNVIGGYIIAYREAHGGFKTIDELKNVNRIGDKTFEGLRDLVVVE